MIAILISWIAILIVFLSFGDCLISLYNKLCKRNENYELIDTFLIGMGAMLIPLSLSSLWLPSNHYILLASLLLSFIYWLVRKDHFKAFCKRLKNSIQQFSIFQLVLFFLIAICFVVVIIWQVGVFDSLLYHQQNIRWNEEYAVVPGLGNVEHRFGFNSNYLLLSAVFGFRFLFGETVYGLHSLVLLAVLFWIVKEIITSDYELRRIALVIPIVGFMLVFGYSFTATSTDLIPNIVAFYLIAKLLIYPSVLKDKLLLLFFVPVCLVTFKLSIAPICLITLYIFISQLRSKNYSTTVFLLSISFLVVAFWCVRNVILSGYLVFPFYELDLFAVDWKIPKHVAIEERDFILSCGIRVLGDMVWRISNWSSDLQSMIDWFTYVAFLGSIIISPLIVLYGFLRKKYLSNTVYFVYLILVAILLVWYKGGPDPRFVGGVLFALIYFLLFVLLSSKEEKKMPRIGVLAVIAFTGFMVVWSVKRTDRFINMFNIRQSTTNTRPLSDILVKQYPYKELLRSRGWYKDEFLPMTLDNGITIYVSKSPEVPQGRFVCFETYFPCIILKEDEYSKYQDISEIEVRGTSLQDGFKPINN